MMELARGNSARPHLFSALFACVVVAAILIAGRIFAVHLEEKTLAVTQSQLFPLKTQGLVFQRAAARAKNVLPLYGSSELLGPRADRASDFFRSAPTGFQVSPVGKLGTTSIDIAQKLAALAPDLRGRKIAISISPAWFLFPTVRQDWYEGNFSFLEASELAFGDGLGFELKHLIAARMVQFPHTVTKNRMLEFAYERLASGRWFDRAIMGVLWPFGKMQNAILDLQDHFEAVLYIRAQPKRPAWCHRRALDWPKLIEKTEQPNVIPPKPRQKKWGADDPRVRRIRDAGFIERVNNAPEWGDLELLLRVLAKVHAQPLLLSMPLDGQYYDDTGVSRSARQVYYERLRALAQRYRFPLVEFEEHDGDPAFLDEQHTHLTAKGWMFYNRALDGFFHGRVPWS